MEGAILIKVQYVHRWNTLWMMNSHLSNERQEYKAAPVRCVLPRRGELIVRVKEGEYGWCTLYTCMKSEHWNLSISFYVGGTWMRENDGGDEPNQVTLQECMEMSQWNSLYNYMLIKMFKET
jgi:hypothetical protein